ncbi:hypothetical protein AQUCO_02700154v1 [Aquilegia coerulea]|uniref:Eukaryotic translation initiation factor 2 subunit beta n=1 Tax=Aquilegia coerulea TaxID=218851 RepID=A0A2G5D5F5_AQUCA|nr:hypothetical protein AQUCO_02700154v1 [Aquilegia coerulea]
MTTPQVFRQGTKVVVFANFMEVCLEMHRQPEHVMTFLLAELRTIGSLDKQQRLVVKGRFATINFKVIFQRYMSEYFTCNVCNGTDTILSMEETQLRCEQCGSERFVAAI